MKRVAVSVKDDYLERMSKTRPINAVAELVWNSLDADADRVTVKLSENDTNFILTQTRARGEAAFLIGRRYLNK